MSSKKSSSSLHNAEETEIFILRNDLNNLSKAFTIMQNEMTEIKATISNMQVVVDQVPKKKKTTDPAAPKRKNAMEVFLAEYIEKKKGNRTEGREEWKNLSESAKETYKEKAKKASNADDAQEEKKSKKSSKAAKSDVETSASAPVQKKKSNKKKAETDVSDASEASEVAEKVTKKKSAKKESEAPAKKSTKKNVVESDEESEEAASPVKKASKKASKPVVQEDSSNSDNEDAKTLKKKVGGKQPASFAKVNLSESDVSDDE